MNMTATIPTRKKQAEMLLSANLINLSKKVLAGESLTAAEVKHLESMEAPDGATAPQQNERSPFAHNQSDLAKILGVSRQLICHHCKRPLSPGRTADGRYQVEAWREYLAAFGRIRVGHTNSSRPQIRADFADGAGAALYFIGEQLPGIVAAALSQAGIKAKPARAESVALALFMQFAPIVDRIVTHWGFPSVYEAEPCEGDESNWPDVIQTLADKHGVNLDEPHH